MSESGLMKTLKLSELPLPPTGREGWPWTVETPPLKSALPTEPALPRVSIVTPSLNQAAFLEETLRSVLLQGYPDLEYLVIDGGSTDGSVEIIRKYASFLSYWVSEPDRGQADAINKGLRRLSGQIVGWLNSDDMLLPRAVQRAVVHLSDHPEIDVVYGPVERINERSHRVPTPLLPKDKVEMNRQNALAGCVVNQPGCFWRSEWTEKVGLLDESLRYAMDYDYWVRFLLAGANFSRLPETMAAFRLSGGSKTVQQAAPMALEGIRVIDSFASRPEVPQMLGLPKEELERQARKGRSIYAVHAFIAYARQRRWGDAFQWLGRALRQNPMVPLERRWLDLLVARLRR